MSNLKKPDPAALSALLKLASARLGTTPEKLQSQLEDGTFSRALGNMPSPQAQMLKKALSDPGSAEKILQTPQAKALYEKLCRGK